MLCDLARALVFYRHGFNMRKVRRIALNHEFDNQASGKRRVLATLLIVHQFHSSFSVTFSSGGILLQQGFDLLQIGRCQFYAYRAGIFFEVFPSLGSGNGNDIILRPAVRELHFCFLPDRQMLPPSADYCPNCLHRSVAMSFESHQPAVDLCFVQWP
jgi:hypothetical protein